MRRVLAPLALIAMAMLLRSACHDRLSIEGSVLDTGGQPVPGIVVTARYTVRGMERTTRVVPEEDGSFRRSLSAPPSDMPIPVSVQAPGIDGIGLGVPRNQHHRLEIVLARTGSGERSSYTLESR